MLYFNSWHSNAHHPRVQSLQYFPVGPKRCQSLNNMTLENSYFQAKLSIDYLVTMKMKHGKSNENVCFLGTTKHESKMYYRSFTGIDTKILLGQ